MPVIMMSGHATIDTAVEATRIGAMAFLEKPITLQKLLHAVEKGLNRAMARPVQMPKPIPSQGGVVDSQVVSAEVRPPLADDSDAAVQTFDLDVPLRDARDAFEKAYFEFHLAKEGGSMTRVAEKTGLERTHLYRKLKQLGVDLNKAKRNGS
jgi:DNA-binding NtrC family response regulator